MGVGEGSDLCLSKKAQKLPSDTVLTNTFFGVVAGSWGCKDVSSVRAAVEQLTIWRGEATSDTHKDSRAVGAGTEASSRLLFGLLSDSLLRSPGDRAPSGRLPCGWQCLSYSWMTLESPGPSIGADLQSSQARGETLAQVSSHFQMILNKEERWEMT